MNNVTYQLTEIGRLIDYGHPTLAEQQISQLILSSDPNSLSRYSQDFRTTIAKFFVPRQRTAVTELLCRRMQLEGEHAGYAGSLSMQTPSPEVKVILTASKPAPPLAQGDPRQSKAKKWLKLHRMLHAKAVSRNPAKFISKKKKSGAKKPKDRRTLAMKVGIPRVRKPTPTTSPCDPETAHGDPWRIHGC